MHGRFSGGSETGEGGGDFPQVVQLHDNFREGVSRLQMYFLLKTGAWEAFRLSLDGMAHLDAEAGKAHGRRLMVEFDSMVIQVTEKPMHKFTLQVLQPHGDIRQHLDEWVAGAYDDSTPRCRSPCSRCSAGCSSGPSWSGSLSNRAMKRLGSFKHVGGALCSLSIRFPRISKTVFDDRVDLGSGP